MKRDTTQSPSLGHGAQVCIDIETQKLYNISSQREREFPEANVVQTARDKTRDSGNSSCGKSSGQNLCEQVSIGDGPGLGLESESVWNPLTLVMGRVKRRLVLLAMFCVFQSYARVQDINPELLVAAAQGDADKVNELLDGGVPVDITNDHGETALILATELGLLDMVRLLLKRDADPNIAIIGMPSTCTEEESPDFPVVCASILPGGKPPFVKQEKWTALHFAADKGRKDIAQLLLKKGAVVDSADARGRTPLMVAAKRGDLPMIKLLLRNRAQVNKKSGSDRTALYYAVAYADKVGDPSLAVIRELKSNGAEVNDEILETAGKRKKNSTKITFILTSPRIKIPLKQLLA